MMLSGSMIYLNDSIAVTLCEVLRYPSFLESWIVFVELLLKSSSSPFVRCHFSCNRTVRSI